VRAFVTDLQQIKMARRVSSLRIRRVCQSALIAKAKLSIGNQFERINVGHKGASAGFLPTLRVSQQIVAMQGETWTFTHNLSEFTPLRL